jgi:sugar phosphate isomerase/epimerase
MLNRRSFLKSSGALAAGSLLPSMSVGSVLMQIAKSKYPPIGLQTYTVPFLVGGIRPGDNIDVKAGLKKLADIGVKELETVGGLDGKFHSFLPKEFSKIVADLGMKWISHHSLGIMGTSSDAMLSKMKTLNTNLEGVIADCVEGGIGYLVCASSTVGTTVEIKKTTEMFVRAGDACKKAGIQFAYHNHQSEFTPIDGTSAYEYIMKQTDKDLVKMELDLAWTTAAGKDPVEMFKEYPGRFPLWHVKDLDKETKKPVPVGKGIVDFKYAFENSKLSGLKHFFIEQDGAKTIEEPGSSITYLNKNIL